MHTTNGPEGSTFHHHGDFSGEVHVYPAPHQRRERCDKCDGTGRREDDSRRSGSLPSHIRCGQCQGAGYVLLPASNLLGDGGFIIPADDLFAFALEFLARRLESEVEKRLDAVRSIKPRDGLELLKGLIV